MTVSKDTRDLLAQRSNGLCEICSTARATNAHHRKPRQMGGRDEPIIDSIVNLLHVCGMGNVSGCHGKIESNRPGAYAFGWLVRNYEDPAIVPVRFAFGWGLLTPDGKYKLTPTPDWRA